jgi:pilus assembly protein CpaF
MLQAMNTGHAGSMTTVHANSAEDVIPRLETLVASGSSIPLPAIRRQIAQALDIIVYIERHAERRLVTQITEVLALDPVTGELELADIFRLESTPTGPALRPTGAMPTFLDQLVRAGLLQPHAWLTEDPAC